MTDQNEPQTHADNGTNDEQPSKKCRKRRGKKFLIVGLLVAAIGAIGLTAVAKHRYHGFMHDEGRFAGFVDHRIEKVLDRIDASDDQKAKIKPILDEASKDLRKAYLDMRDKRQTYVTALLGNNVNRQAIETLRAEQMASMDQVSQRMTKAITDAAEILTPEQRAKLAKKLERRNK